MQWDSHQYWEFPGFLLSQLSYLLQGLMNPKVVKESLRLIAMLDRSLEPWKNGRRREKSGVDRFDSFVLWLALVCLYISSMEMEIMCWLLSILHAGWGTFCRLDCLFGTLGFSFVLRSRSPIS